MNQSSRRRRLSNSLAAACVLLLILGCLNVYVSGRAGVKHEAQTPAPSQCGADAGEQQQQCGLAGSDEQTEPKIEEETCSCGCSDDGTGSIGKSLEDTEETPADDVHHGHQAIKGEAERKPRSAQYGRHHAHHHPPRCSKCKCQRLHPHRHHKHTDSHEDFTHGPRAKTSESGEENDGHRKLSDEEVAIHNGRHGHKRGNDDHHRHSHERSPHHRHDTHHHSDDDDHHHHHHHHGKHHHKKSHHHHHQKGNHHHHHHHQEGDHHQVHHHKKHQREQTHHQHHSKYEGHDHRHLSEQELAAKEQKSTVRVWIEAISATVLIGLAPIAILPFIPISATSTDLTQQKFLKVLLAFAAGGLLGDSFLHLLPHSLEHSHSHDAHDHDHGHAHGEEGHHHTLSDLKPWLWCLTGLLTFWVLEKFVRARTGEGHGHSHSHAPGHSHDTDSNIQKKEDAAKHKRDDDHPTSDGEEEEEDDPSSEDENAEAEVPRRQSIAAAGYLNLAADFTHNFTDGLAMGATFTQGKGFSTTIAILLHEVPHEIGDYAILIRSGFTKKQAMLAQAFTAFGCLVGTIIGLLAHNVGGNSWITPFTAGGFIYIATVSVLPDLLEDSSASPLQTIAELLAMITGVGLMVMIALFE